MRLVAGFLVVASILLAGCGGGGGTPDSASGGGTFNAGASLASAGGGSASAGASSNGTAPTSSQNTANAGSNAATNIDLSNKTLNGVSSLYGTCAGTVESKGSLTFGAATISVAGESAGIVGGSSTSPAGSTSGSSAPVTCTVERRTISATWTYAQFKSSGLLPCGPVCTVAQLNEPFEGIYIAPSLSGTANAATGTFKSVISYDSTLQKIIVNRTITQNNQSSTSRMEFVLATNSFIFGDSSSSGSGGGSSSGSGSASSGGNTGTVVPVASSSSFNLLQAYQGSLVDPQSGPFSVSGTMTGSAGTFPLTGTGVFTPTNISSGLFEENATKKRSVTINFRLTVNGNITDKSESIIYLMDKDSLPVAEIGSAEYVVVRGPSNTPTTVRVGDSGQVYVADRYSDSSKKTRLGTRTQTYSVEADTANTAFVTFTNTSTDLSGKVTKVDSSVFRITSSGTFSRVKQTSRDYLLDSDITITYL